MLSQPIKNYEDYTINENGEVFSIKRNKYLKQRVRSGYLAVTLCKNGKPEDFNIHQLIAEYFIENDDPLNKICVDHIDENKQNNSLDNLRFATPSQNNRNVTKKKRKDDLPRGVYESGKKWIARIQINGKTKNLGTFDTPELASEAYKSEYDIQMSM